MSKKGPRILSIKIWRYSNTSGKRPLKYTRKKDPWSRFAKEREQKKRRGKVRR